MAAFCVSLLFHPFVIAPATVLLLTDARSSLLVVAVTVVPMLTLIAINVRRGRWTNYDVSVRTQRPALYWSGVLVSGALALLFRSEPKLFRGALAAAVMIAVAMLINRWLKLSLHMMFGLFCAVIVAWKYPAVAMPISAAIALLAWSRLALRRHTYAEVFVGSVVGAVTGAWLVLT